MNKIADQINIASDQGDVIKEVVDETIVVDNANVDETLTDDVIKDETVLLVDDEPIVEEKEPTIKELMETISAQGKQIEKANKRTGYLQRKYDRAGQVQTIEAAKEKPSEDSFETNAEFVEALTDWKVDERQRLSNERQVEQNSKDKAEDFSSAMELGPEKYPDFEAVVRKSPADGGPQITQSMVDAMIEGENPVDVAYYLAQNVKESERIARLSPIGVAREIGRIEERFAGGKKQVTPQKTKTKTITPSSPIVGKTSVKGDLESMDTDDFMKERNKADGVA